MKSSSEIPTVFLVLIFNIFNRKVLGLWNNCEGSLEIQYSLVLSSDISSVCLLQLVGPHQYTVTKIHSEFTYFSFFLSFYCHDIHLSCILWLRNSQRKIYNYITYTILQYIIIWLHISGIFIHIHSLCLSINTLRKNTFVFSPSTQNVF